MPYSVRRPTLADAPALLELMCTCDIAAMGRPDTTLADVLDELREPDLDLEQDGWIAVDDGGVAVACGFVLRQAGADLVELDVYVDPAADALGPQLWDLVETRAAEIGRELGHRELRVDVGIHQTDDRTRAIATGRGYEPVAVFYRMRTDHTGPVPLPDRPDGVRIDVAGADEGLRRAAYTVDNESFAEHFGFAPRSYDWWDAKFESSSVMTWDLVKVASVDGDPAGVLMRSTQYVEDETCGYVDTLGVRKEYRGRGIGRLLLLDAFAADAADGFVGTILHVDANNVTPALGLYESVGMRQVLAIDGWRRTIPTAT